MQWSTIITAVVAVYGAILSTHTAVANYREKKRRVIVTVSIGFRVYGTGPGPSVVFVSAANPGSRPVSLNGLGFLLPDGRQCVLPYSESDVEFPHELMEGRSCRIWIPTKVLAHELRGLGFSGTIKLKGFYNDAVGTTYKSKPTKFEINEWLNSS
jgi:hypothetical protein